MDLITFYHFNVILEKMSKQAIKTYFDNARREKKMSRRIQPIQDVQPQEIYVVDQAKLEEAFENLRNCNTLFNEQLLHYVASMDEEEYEYVLSRRKELSSELQNLIWPEPIKFNFSKKLKVVDLTDQMQFEMLKKKLKEENKKLDELCAKQEIPPRPIGQLDLKLSDLKEKLVKAEKNLEDITKSIKPKAYIPPAMRQQMAAIDPKVVEAKSVIQKIKNEITSTEVSIETQNGKWKDDRLFEIRQKLKLEMCELS